VIDLLICWITELANKRVGHLMRREVRLACRYAGFKEELCIIFCLLSINDRYCTTSVRSGTLTKKELIRSNVPSPVPENPVGPKTVSAVKHNKVKSDCQPQIFSEPI
jgi:hypothetical protein